MRDILADVERWRAGGVAVAVATVVETWGSAPRPAGSKMAVGADGSIAGSVSGGCVENAVIEAAQEVLRSRIPRLLHFGVTDDAAWSVGLACGGTIDVFVEPLGEETYGPVRDALVQERPAAVATVIRGPGDVLGKKIALLSEGRTEGAADATLAAASEALARGTSRRISLGETEIFVDVLMPSPRLVIVGGVHVAIPLVTLAKAIGFRTILVDPRESFANAKRFPHADEIVSTSWPDEAIGTLGVNSSTAIAVLTHDPKLDDPALTAALRSPAFYVGALGSRRTHEKRRERLLAAGMSEEELSRLHAPIGLPLGGRSPEEIALAIVAQIVALRNNAAAF